MGEGMNSKRPVAPEGFEPRGGQLAVRGQHGPSGISSKTRTVFGVVWSLIGSTFVPVVPVLSNVLIAFGATLAYGNGGRRGQIISLLAALVAGGVSTYLTLDVYGLPMTLVSVACAFTLSWALVSGRFNTSWLLVAAAAVTAAMIGIDTVSTSLQGTTITNVVANVVDKVVEASIGSLDLEGTTALLETRDQMVMYWPTIYFVVGASTAVCSLLGARVAARASNVQVVSGLEAIAHYDVPLWVAVLFALGVAAQLLGPHLPAWREEVAMVGANVIMITRLALAQQGLSVLQWWLREHNVRWFTRTFAVFAAVWLEMLFALASVVGLLDVAMNFRRLDRGRPDLVPRPSGER